MQNHRYARLILSSSESWHLVSLLQNFFVLSVSWPHLDLTFHPVSNSGLAQTEMKGGWKHDKPLTRSSVMDNNWESSASPLPQDSCHESKQDVALTAVIHAYEHCMAELQCKAVVTKLLMELAELCTDVTSLKCSNVFMQTKLKELKKKTTRSAANGVQKLMCFNWLRQAVNKLNIQ